MEGSQYQSPAEEQVSMAERSGNNIHHSIVASQAGNPLKLVECSDVDCSSCAGLQKVLYHCPLCPLKFQIRSKLSDHHASVHWNCRISFAGRSFSSPHSWRWRAVHTRTQRCRLFLASGSMCSTDIFCFVTSQFFVVISTYSEILQHSSTTPSTGTYLLINKLAFLNSGA